MQLNFPRVFPKSKTKFTCFFNLSWSKDFPPVDTNMEVHKKWREHWKTEIRKYRITEIHMFSWSAACAPSLASSSSLCPFPLWWTGHISTKPKIHHSSMIIKNDHQLWPIKTVSRALFSGCDSRGHEIELTWGKFHYLESWTKAKIGTLMVSRYLICAPNSRLFQITQNEFYSCMLPSNFIRKKLFAFLLNCRGKCRFI